MRKVFNRKLSKKEAEKIIKAYTLKTVPEAKQNYLDDVLYFTMLQTLADAVYELFVNMNMHIEKVYGIRTNTKQKHNFSKLKNSIEDIKFYFSKVSATNIGIYNSKDEEAAGDLLLGLSDFNVDFCKLFLYALTAANIQDFCENKHTEEAVIMESLWNTLLIYAKKCRMFNDLKFPNINQVFEESAEYIEIINNQNKENNETDRAEC